LFERDGAASSWSAIMLAMERWTESKHADGAGSLRNFSR